jgi:pimeloyl-ACP methyl ester carboxylesterase
MAEFIRWDSQPLDEWGKKYAAGKFISIDGHSTHYIEKGKGEPVILLHGFFYDSYLWNRNIDALVANGCKVYALDLWGFGYSTREPLDYGYALYAGQLLKFMDAMNIRKASLIGQSMGGGTCIAFAVGHRDRVNRIVLVDPAGMPQPLPLTARLTVLPGIGEFLLGLNNNFYRKMVLRMNFIYDKAIITDSYLENVTRFHKVKGTNEVLNGILRKKFFFTLKDEIQKLGEMDVPILIVWGRQDKGVPLKQGQEMHKILKTSRLEVLEHAGHCPNDERSEEFNRLAPDFLSSKS